MSRVTPAPCLWFDDQADAAARHDTSILPDSRILQVTYYGDRDREIHGGTASATRAIPAHGGAGGSGTGLAFLGRSFPSREGS
jgi:hypothetical protein